MEGADQILAERRVDRGLAADAGIDLREQRRRDLHQPYAAPQRGGAEAGEIADHAAAERDDDVAPLDMGGDQRVRNARELGIGFRRLARRADDDARRKSGAGKALHQIVEMQRRDVFVGDHRATRAGRKGLDMRARRGDQSFADQDLVGALAERDWNLAHAGSARRRHVFRFDASAQSRHDRIHGRLMRPVARFDRDVGEPIGRAALVEQPAQGRLGIGGLQQRAVRAFANSSQQHLEFRLQPDRDARGGDALAGDGVHEGAAAGREHLLALVEQASDHLAFAVAEIGLAEALEDLRDGHARPGLDLGVGIDERQAQPLGEPASDRRLPSPHHADEDDRTSAERRGERLRLLSGLVLLSSLVVHAWRAPSPGASFRRPS